MPELDEQRRSTPVGYNLVPPPGWDRIPLQSESMNDTILRIIDRSIANLPQDLPKDDVSKARMELFKQLKKAARQTAKNDGLMLYLPVVPHLPDGILGATQHVTVQKAAVNR
ncbi:hypothetical protein [Streptomyces sp. NPDC001480]|uniref:hypothetical protein n=1 Tax=Streptomyces sp. NPDC001480 TaxID=3364577 RepID=UPI0036CFD083